MKLSILITVFSIDDSLFNLLDKFNLIKSNVEIILSLPKIDTNKDINTLKNYIREFENIKLIELKTNNVNEGRNKFINLSTGEYLLFIDTYNDIQIENIISIFDRIDIRTDIINLDYIQINNISDMSLEEFTRLEIVEKQSIISKERYLNKDNIISGLEFYSICKNKNISVVELYSYLFRLDFIKSNNLYFSEYLINDSNIFIIEAFIKCSTIKYINLPLIMMKKIDNMYLNENYLEYNSLNYKFMIIDKLIEIYNLYHRYEYKIIILNETFNLCKKTMHQVHNNNDYSSYHMLIKYIGSIKNLAFKESKCYELEIKYSILEDYPIIIENSENNVIINFNKIIYNTVYELENIILNIQNNNILEEDIIDKIINTINSNRNISKYNTYDNIINILNNYSNDKNKELIRNIKKLSVDILSSINEKVLYYSYFEEKFDTILDNIKR